MAGALGAAGGAARAAVSLLTIVPVGVSEAEPQTLRRAAAWFPLVGGLVGALAAGAYALTHDALGREYAAALALLVSAVAAGALHHDGLADTLDGLGPRGGRELRLAAMRDSGIGAFGALALIAFVVLSLAALARLAPEDAVAALIAAHALGRWAALPQMLWIAPARRDGLGAAFAAGPVEVAVGSVVAVAVAVALCGVVAGLAAAAGAAITAGLVAWAARGAFGGRTGDTLGAAVLVSEVVVYSVLSAYWVV